MTILIQNTSAVPLYQQIVDQIKAQIVDGRLPQGEALPSIRALARDLSVSIITTKRAYEELEAQGFIQTAPGRGSFVQIRDRERLAEVHQQQMNALLEQAAAAAHVAGLDEADFLKAAEGFFKGEA